MKPAPLPADETDRLRLLTELRLSEADIDPAFAAVARLVCRHSGWPIGGVSVVDAAEQWFLAAVGLDSSLKTPRELSFCGHTLLADQGFEVADASTDARFHDHPLVVAAPHVRAYAGMPVQVDGHRIGSVCVVDHRPHRLDDAARAALRDLAALAGALLEARLREHRSRLQEERVRGASRAGSDWLWESDVDGYMSWVSDSAEAHTGEPAAAEIGRLGRAYNLPPGDEHRASYENYLRARAERQPFKDAVGMRHTPRGTLMLAMSGLPVFDADGRFKGYRGAARDITDALAQRSAAERTQLLLREAIERVAAGVMVSNADGHILMSNAEWRASMTRHVPAVPERWPELVRALVDAGAYPDARGREDEFVRWRLALPTPEGTQHELRFGDEHVLVTDQRMPDGSVIHLSIDITPRRHAELALAEQQARLSAVLRALPDLWFVIDGDGRYLECSDEQHPALLRPFAQMRGKRFAELRPGPQAGRVEQGEQAIRDARVSGEVQRYEYALTTPDGRRRQFEARIAPMTGERVLYLTRDITEHTRASRQLELSEALYRSVAASISDGLLVVGPDEAIVTANPSACALLGARAQALAGQRLSRIGYELQFEDGTPVPMPQHPITEVLKTGHSALDRVHRLRRPGGSERLLRLSALPLRLRPDDTQISCVVTFRDITAQRAAEAALAQAEARWRFALEGAGDGVWDHDEETGQVFYSPRWKSLIGYHDNEIGGSLLEWSRRVHPDDDGPVREAIRRYRAGETDEYRTEHRLRHKDGHWIWVLDRAKIVERRADGSPRRVVGIHTDITRLKAAEEALREKQAAELASRAKTEFLSRMSHEMRTPLNAVIGFAQLLQMSSQGGEASAAQVAQFSEHILSSGRHLLALVNDVLDLQQVEEGRLSLKLESVSLQAAVDGALELIGPQAAGRGIAVERRIDASTRVRADAQRLRQVLLNLLSNGVKYNREGGRLRCVLESADGERAVLLIEDSGPGLSPTEQARLFQPFERLGRETSSVEGTGLGLIISRRLVQEMGGDLRLSSQLGRGTQVRIELPLAVAVTAAAADTETIAAALPAGSAPGEPEPATGPLRMLYVEDNRLNAILFEEAVKRRGDIELRIAEDGPEALALVRDWPPQVLVLDANLPSMSGYELLRRLRSLAPFAGTPAFMCSADALPSDLQRAREAGFAGYWTKPIDIERVIADLDALGTATA